MPFSAQERLAELQALLAFQEKNLGYVPSGHPEQSAILAGEIARTKKSILLVASDGTQINR